MATARFFESTRTEYARGTMFGWPKLWRPCRCLNRVKTLPWSPYDRSRLPAPPEASVVAAIDAAIPTQMIPASRLSQTRYMSTKRSRCREVASPVLNGRGLDGSLLGGVLADLERGSAAAGGDDVRVVDHEAGALEAIDVVDLRAEDELHAHLVDDDRDALVLEDVIV